MGKMRHIVMVWVLLAVGAFTVFDWWWIKENNTHHLLQVVFLDVGQGTSVYVRTPQGIELLYDTGATTQTLRQVEQYRLFTDRTLDYLLLSHADWDHSGMAPRILESYRVKHVIQGPGRRDVPLIDAIDERLDTQNTEGWGRGLVRVLDHETWIEVFHPEIHASESSNAFSLVVRLVHKNTSVLLTGDITQAVERELGRMYKGGLDSDLLLVSHHGSKSSSDEGFISIVDPEYAIVSAGARNSYGHPHQAVLERFARQGVRLLRTDTSGDIVFLSDGLQFYLMR